MNTTFKQKVKAERTRLHYTQKTFAKWTEVSYPTYAKWEEGKGNISFTDAVKIAKALDLSIDACYGINQGEIIDSANKDKALAELNKAYETVYTENDTLKQALSKVKEHNFTLSNTVKALCAIIGEII